MQLQLFKVRDLRKKEQFIIDDIYLNGYAKECGIYATGVYVSLCRHADKEQKSWPSIKKLAEELNVSVASVKRGLNSLEKLNIIKRERLGKKLNNRYYLIDKSEWSGGAITVSPQSHHQGSIGAIHSKDTHSKDTQVRGNPYFKGHKMRSYFGAWQVLEKGGWINFVGKENDIQWQ